MGEINIAEESTSNSSDIQRISLQPGSPTWLIPVQLEKTSLKFFSTSEVGALKVQQSEQSRGKEYPTAATLSQSAGVAIVQAAVGSVQAVVGGGSISLTV